MSLMFFNIGNLKFIFNKTIIVTSLFFSTNTFSNILIAKDENLAKDLTINHLDGKEIIDIERADIRGISHNYYTDFNVGKNGTIFNNPEALYVTTIINEVTSKNKTLLMGPLSINGQPANIIIANPNGIHCQGCSFNGIEKVTLINGVSDKLNIGKYDISNKGNIEFSLGERTGRRFIFDKINIISKEIKFNEGVKLFSNELNIINGKQFYHMYNNINSKFHKGILLFDFNTIINANKLNYSAGNGVLINKGILNVGGIEVRAKGKVINLGEINILSNRINAILDNIYGECKTIDFLKKIAIFNAKLFNNEKNARLTVYNTSIQFDLPKGNFFNKGYMSLEHSEFSANVRNYLHIFESTTFNNQSSMIISSEKRVIFDGGIGFLDEQDKILINKGFDIKINKQNSNSILIRY